MPRGIRYAAALTVQMHMYFKGRRECSSVKQSESSPSFSKSHQKKGLWRTFQKHYGIRFDKWGLEAAKPCFGNQQSTVQGHL